MALFGAALAFVLKNEGSTYVDHVSDRGGPTRYGITLATLSKWRHAIVSAKDVELVGLAEVTEIYRARYWQAIAGDDLKSQIVTTATFDAAVLCGPNRAIRFMQRAIKVQADGIMGPVTLAAANAHPERHFIVPFMQQYSAHLLRSAQAPGQNLFLAGWIHRTNRLAELLV